MPRRILLSPHRGSGRPIIGEEVGRQRFDSEVIVVRGLWPDSSVRKHTVFASKPSCCGPIDDRLPPERHEHRFVKRYSPYR